MLKASKRYAIIIKKEEERRVCLLDEMIMKRKIYEKLLKWKNENIVMPLMVIGARQVGKTYIIKKFCNQEFQKSVYINLLEHTEIVKLFKEEISTEEKFMKLQLILNKSIDIENTIIFFDEVQESEELISSLKYFCEDERPFKIICAGSLLGVKINRFHSSFPVGKVQMINMYPMSFDEFILANMPETGEALIKEIKKCYELNKEIELSLHNKLIWLYRTYICVGGMPACVDNFVKCNGDILKYNKEIIRNIIDAYLNDMNKYVLNSFEATRIEEIYKTIPTQLENTSKKFQYSKIKKGARSKDYESALNWLYSSNLIHKCTILNSVNIPPKAYIDNEVFKLFLSDIGILTSLLEINYNEITLDMPFLYKGILAENYVAEEFIQNNISLYYWKSKSDAEIDFVIYNDQGLIPIEVKSSDNTKSKSLNIYMTKYKPKYAIRISSKNFGFKNNIKSVPLYAVFLIK